MIPSTRATSAGRLAPVSQVGLVQVETSDGRTLLGKDPYYDSEAQLLLMMDPRGEVIELPRGTIRRLLRRGPRWAAYASVAVLIVSVLTYTSPRWLSTLALAPKATYLLGAIAGAMTAALVMWVVQDIPGMWEWKETSIGADA